MAEYIKKDDAIRVVEKYFTDCLELNSDICLDGIRSLPDADVVERKSCNTCQYYEGVHNVAGIAPCSFWDIGGVMWNDFCSRWKGENDG